MIGNHYSENKIYIKQNPGKHFVIRDFTLAEKGIIDVNTLDFVPGFYWLKAPFEVPEKPMTVS